MTTWWLEMRSPGQLRPSAAPSTDLVLAREIVVGPELARHLYRSVGHEWTWVDRLPWDDEQWRCRLAVPEVQILVANVGGDHAGYFELESTRDGDVEIAHLGLLERFMGRGHGGHLLTMAVRQAWATPGASRVWVHTCSLDAPHAMANYLARGFTIFRTQDQDSGPAGPTSLV